MKLSWCSYLLYKHCVASLIKHCPSTPSCLWLRDLLVVLPGRGRGGSPHWQGAFDLPNKDWSSPSSSSRRREREKGVYILKGPDFLYPTPYHTYIGAIVVVWKGIKKPFHAGVKSGKGCGEGFFLLARLVFLHYRIFLDLHLLQDVASLSQIKRALLAPAFTICEAA